MYNHFIYPLPINKFNSTFWNSFDATYLFTWHSATEAADFINADAKSNCFGFRESCICVVLTHLSQKPVHYTLYT